MATMMPAADSQFNVLPPSALLYEYDHNHVTPLRTDPLAGELRADWTPA
jgi:hypothetical protein